MAKRFPKGVVCLVSALVFHGLPVALEGLQEALRQRKAKPAEIVRAADAGGVATVIRPYLEALTANG